MGLVLVVPRAKQWTACTVVLLRARASPGPRVWHGPSDVQAAAVDARSAARMRHAAAHDALAGQTAARTATETARCWRSPTGVGTALSWTRGGAARAALRQRGRCRRCAARCVEVDAGEGEIWRGGASPPLSATCLGRRAQAGKHWHGVSSRARLATGRGRTPRCLRGGGADAAANLSNCRKARVVGIRTLHFEPAVGASLAAVARRRRVFARCSFRIAAGGKRSVYRACSASSVLSASAGPACSSGTAADMVA